VQVKALACELPHRMGLPLSRFSIAGIRREVLKQGLVAEISGATIWRWLSKDAICPWRHRSWIFPRDPLFVEKASPILDLYQGLWQGQPLGPNDEPGALSVGGARVLDPRQLLRSPSRFATKSRRLRSNGPLPERTWPNS
jgi:hypothetical protein